MRWPGWLQPVQEVGDQGRVGWCGCRAGRPVRRRQCAAGAVWPVGAPGAVGAGLDLRAEAGRGGAETNRASLLE